jgi:hypothetical protein
MKTKKKITAYIFRSRVAAVLLSSMVVALSSASNLPNNPPNFSTSRNDLGLGMNGHENPSPVAVSTMRRHQTLTFTDRVAYQRAIEEVYWRHRIWPKANAGAKPPLDKLMSQAQIEKKVEDYLLNSQALEEYYKQPLSAEQLQGEMDRMAKDTKQPEVLREIFDGLGNDPFVIAECLARPVLAERMITGSHVTQTKTELSRRNVVAAATVNYTLPTISDGVTGCIEDTWTAMSTTNAPSPRFGHTAVWTGSEMIVWGGWNGTDYFNTGARYNPSTDSWTATSTTNAPTARFSHTAVWTGLEMIVWGGNSGLDTNTGGRYDPGTDIWTPTSTTNAPDARELQTAVWTGTEMIVWGGVNSDLLRLYRSGGRYNSSTDSWTDTSTANAPTARDMHTVVWTGSEMIVWGGNTGGGMVNSGGRYSPSTNTWIATSITNAPAPRWLHTAVWTTTEMIVWGGSSGSPSSGGRYNPSTDSWTVTSTTNAPTQRLEHTAVWTGSEMIVWGGSGVGGYVNTGGKYNPSTDGWIATSTTNAPDGRQLHTAVWTGSEMIVWGGNSGFPNPFNTGGRYCVQSSASTPTPTPTATTTPTATATPTATSTPTPTPTPCTGRCTPTPRPRPTPVPRP